MSTNHDARPVGATRGDLFGWARDATGPSADEPAEDPATSPADAGISGWEPDPRPPAERTHLEGTHVERTRDVDERARSAPLPGPRPGTEADPPVGQAPSRVAGQAVGRPDRFDAAPAARRSGPAADPGSAYPAAAGGFEPDAWAAHPLAASSIVRARAPRPRHGWRAALYTITGGRIAPQLSADEQRRTELLRRVRTPLPGPRKITVVSMKGGVGKTTVSGVLGLTLGEHRGDRAIAIDANPDAGTLADRLVGAGPGPTIRELITDLTRITAATELTRYTRLAGRLHVLPSEQDPAMSEQFNKDEYDAVINLLERFYDILITDSGTGVVHSAMSGALEHTDQLVIVGAPTVDAASRAAKTLDWLIEHDFADLVGDAVVALSRDRESPDVDRAQIRDYFAGRCRAVVEIPFDAHLRTGDVIDLQRLGQPALDSALLLSAHVADGFHHHPTTLAGPYPRRRR